ncbi:hypothetical protein [Ehrlichia canis]|uniref:Uncharacterized protein n=1 Tax=Ehrlichia canis (strain Jake) TaxID=269484 RepID=A0ACA6AWI9_EHRCJ|nr:hypothetical protein [Ehrlichia canis]AAZ68802.1 hypothetical protein Ecaj_0771 [Ehrlichia canis str. Jake]
MSFLDVISGVFASLTSNFFNNTTNSTLGTIRGNVTGVYNTLVNYVTTFFNSTVVNTNAVTGSSALNNTLPTIDNDTIHFVNSTIDDVLRNTNHSVINTSSSSDDWNKFFYCLLALGFVCVIRRICYHFMRGFREERHRDLMIRGFFSEAEVENNGIGCESRERSICCNVKENIVRQRNDISTEGDEGLSVNQCEEELHSICGGARTDISEKGSDSSSIGCEEIALNTMSTNVVVEMKVTEMSTFL